MQIIIIGILLFFFLILIIDKNKNKQKNRNIQTKPSKKVFSLDEKIEQEKKVELQQVTSLVTQLKKQKVSELLFILNQVQQKK